MEDLVLMARVSAALGAIARGEPCVAAFSLEQLERAESLFDEHDA